MVVIFMNQSNYSVNLEYRKLLYIQGLKALFSYVADDAIFWFRICHLVSVCSAAPLCRGTTNIPFVRASKGWGKENISVRLT